MKCISLWQPWASVLFCKDSMTGYPLKVDETRHWRTNVRGRVAVHAAKQKPDYDTLLRYGISMCSIGLYLGTLPFGKIIGTIELIDCKRTEDVSQERYPWQLFWGNYSAGRFAWVFRDIRRELLKEPIPWKGTQGWFEVPDELIHPEGVI